MINELIEKKDALFEMAEVMFGEDFIIEAKFWESSINRDLIEVHDKLEVLGWKPEGEITPEMIQAAAIVAKKLGFESDEDIL